MPEPDALQRASLYVEDLKYGPGDGKIEKVDQGQLVSQIECLLRDAGVTSTTGQEVFDSLQSLVSSQIRTLITARVPAPSAIGSSWLDGLLHGIALAGDLDGTRRGAFAPERGGDRG